MNFTTAERLPVLKFKQQCNSRFRSSGISCCGNRIPTFRSSAVSSSSNAHLCNVFLGISNVEERHIRCLEKSGSDFRMTQHHIAKERNSYVSTIHVHCVRPSVRSSIHLFPSVRKMMPQSL